LFSPSLFRLFALSLDRDDAWSDLHCYFTILDPNTLILNGDTKSTLPTIIFLKPSEWRTPSVGRHELAPFHESHLASSSLEYESVEAIPNEWAYLDNPQSPESSIHIIVLSVILWPISCRVWVPSRQPSRQFISSLFQSFCRVCVLFAYRSRRFISSFFQSYSGQYLVKFASFRVIRVVDSYHCSFYHTLANFLPSLLYVPLRHQSRRSISSFFHSSSGQILSNLCPPASSESLIHIIALSIKLWPTSGRFYIPLHHPSRWLGWSFFHSYSEPCLVELVSLVSSVSSIHIIALIVKMLLGYEMFDLHE